MSMLEALREIDNLKDLSEENLEKLVGICREVEYGPRQTIFGQYDEGKDIYFVISGKVSLAVCDANMGCRQIAEVGKGGLVGWAPLLKRRSFSAAARTLEPVKAIVINGDELYSLCQRVPELGFEVMHRVAEVLAERLTATRVQLLHLHGHGLPEMQIESD